ncbi:potassium channel protein [Spongiivirga sp. MCCC 1A20706]|uniref:potassium channel family protein n=1 Tax=Spongiivirga sp. MCCC 1A20706 TaxID=3160963 RepID=UPI0039779D3B
MFKLFRSKFTIAISLLITIYLIGVIGYRYISGFGWIDSMFMTMITVTTVGFSTVKELDPASKIFTICLIVTSVFIFGYAITVITEYIFSRTNSILIKKKKMKRQIDQLRGHVIVCGYGRNGKQAVHKLMSYGKDFVVVEMDKGLVERFEDDNILFVNGNANEDEILLEAGIERAHCMITALPKDADNLFVVLSARQLNKDLTIISRASEDTSYKKLKLAGANNVIMPDRIGGDHMASLVVEPGLVEFIDNLTMMDHGDLTNIEEVAVADIFEKNNGNSTIRDIDLRKRTGCTIIGFKKQDGSYIVNPEADTILEPDSSIIVLGRPEQIKALNKMYQL